VFTRSQEYYDAIYGFKNYETEAEKLCAHIDAHKRKAADTLLDVACGTGYALPLIADGARSVTACDRDAINLADARTALPTGAFCHCDAQRLPFRDGSFDVVACLEAIYYLQDWRAFVSDARRVLRPGGTLVITWPNPARPVFSRSPSSTVYPRVEEMTEVLAAAGFRGRCYGAFAFDDLATARRRWLDTVRRAVVGLHLIPQTLRVRMMVKRLLYRRMRRLEDITLTPDPYSRLVALRPGTRADFAMLYLVAAKSAEDTP